MPFVHNHKKNEIYIILSGKGSAVLDGEKLICRRRCDQVAPAVKRQFSAAADSLSAGPVFRFGRIPSKSILPGMLSSDKQDHSHNLSGVVQS